VPPTRRERREQRALKNVKPRRSWGPVWLAAAALGGYLLSGIKGANELFTGIPKLWQNVASLAGQRSTIQIDLTPPPPTVDEAEVVIALSDGSVISRRPPAKFELVPQAAFKIIARGPALKTAILEPAAAGKAGELHKYTIRFVSFDDPLESQIFRRFDSADAVRAAATLGTPQVVVPTTANDLAWRVISLTAEFEMGNADVWGNAQGNFDGSGITFGAVGFTVKTGEMTALLSEMRRRDQRRFDGIMGSGLQAMLQLLTARDAMAIATSSAFQDPKGKLHDGWIARFRALGGDPAFRLVQVERLLPYVDRARAAMRTYGLRSERAVALLYDISIQNGGIRPRAGEQIQRAFAATNGPALSEVERMVIIGNAVADATSARWQEQVRARKLLIAHGQGKLFGRVFDLEERGITLAAAQ
jgi:hypothetical protein